MKITMNTKTILATSLAAVFAVSMILAGALVPAQAGQAETGNGAPSGAHFNLNLVGHPRNDQFTNDETNNGHVIHVKLQGRSDIYLKQGTPFAVLDSDATDGRGEFQLPAPENQYDADGNFVGEGNYQVFIRVVGIPKKTAELVTCGENTILNPDGTTTTERTCSLEILTLESKTGKKVFDNVTKELTTILYDDDGDPTTPPVRVDIFSSEFQDYLWQYDNNGIKVVQLRFYLLD